MRGPYSQFQRRDRLPGEPFAPTGAKQGRTNRSFIAQLAAGTTLAALLGWQTAPQTMEWLVKANSTPEQIAAVEQSVHYVGCNDARAAGVAPIHRGQPGYRQDMDGDDDGIACEPQF